MVNTQKPPEILLLGTSHANELYPGFAKNRKLGHHTILSIGTCDAAWVDRSQFVKPIPGFEYSPCVGYRHADQQDLIDGIVARGSLRFVVFAGLNKASDDDYVRRLKRRIDFFESNNIKVIVFIPHIAIDHDIKECFARPFKSPGQSCEMSREEYRKASGDITPIVRQLSSTNPGVLFFDQNDLFCNADKCSLIRNGMPLIRDTYGHLSEYGSIELSNIFEKWAAISVPSILQ